MNLVTLQASAERSKPYGLPERVIMVTLSRASGEG